MMSAQASSAEKPMMVLSFDVEAYGNSPVHNTMCSSASGRGGELRGWFMNHPDVQNLEVGSLVRKHDCTRENTYAWCSCFRNHFVTN